MWFLTESGLKPYQPWCNFYLCAKVLIIYFISFFMRNYLRLYFINERMYFFEHSTLIYHIVLGGCLHTHWDTLKWNVIWKEQWSIKKIVKLCLYFYDWLFLKRMNFVSVENAPLHTFDFSKFWLTQLKWFFPMMAFI